MPSKRLNKAYDILSTEHTRVKAYLNDIEIAIGRVKNVKDECLAALPANRWLSKMTIKQAMYAVLAVHGGPMKMTHVAEKLLKGHFKSGKVLTAEKAYQYVYQTVVDSHEFIKVGADPVMIDLTVRRKLFDENENRLF